MQQLNFLELLTHLGINGAQIAAIVGSIMAIYAHPLEKVKVKCF